MFRVHRPNFHPYGELEPRVRWPLHHPYRTPTLLTGAVVGSRSRRHRQGLGRGASADAQPGSPSPDGTSSFWATGLRIGCKHPCPAHPAPEPPRPDRALLKRTLQPEPGGSRAWGGLGGPRGARVPLPVLGRPPCSPVPQAPSSLCARGATGVFALPCSWSRTPARGQHGPTKPAGARCRRAPLGLPRAPGFTALV